MATLQQNKAPTNASDAEFRAWAQFVHDALGNAGWVQTSDTGQINLTTVSKPSGSNTAQGYEIWRTNDSLTDAYLKIEYGSGANGANFPAIWCTLGWGSNGSGTLTGNTTTRHRFNGGGQTSTTYPCYASGTTGLFAMVLFDQIASGFNYSMCLLIDRLRDAAGDPIDNAMWIGMYGPDYGSGIGSTLNASQVCLGSGTNPSGLSSIPCIQGRDATTLIGSTYGVFPILPIGQVAYPAALPAVGFYYNDIGDATTFTVSRYGADRTYLACRLASSNSPGFGQFASAGNNSFPTACPAILWE